MGHKIKVVIGTDIKRESVLLSKEGDVLAEGTNSRSALRKLYGR